MASQPEPAAAGEDDTGASGEPPLPQRSRREVVRDVLFFQVKLFVDGLRDIILSPISLLLGLIGVLVSRQPGEPFYRLLRAGRATEHWIDLFGAAYPDEVVARGERNRQMQQDMEQHLRALEDSLKGEDYNQAARDNAQRLRDLLTKYRSSNREEN